jgi:hypothetical protein
VQRPDSPGEFRPPRALPSADWHVGEDFRERRPVSLRVTPLTRSTKRFQLHVAGGRAARRKSRKRFESGKHVVARQADDGLRQLSACVSAGDGFLVAARALGLGLRRQVAGLVPARRQLAHAYDAVLRVNAAATTHVQGYDLRKRIVRAAVIHRHGVWIMPLPLRSKWPREESNLRTQIRSLPLYPLSYGAG